MKKDIFKSKTFALSMAAVLMASAAVVVLAFPDISFKVGDTTISIKKSDKPWTVVGSGENVPDPDVGTNSGICGFWVFETGSTYTGELTAADAGYIDGGSGVNATELTNVPHSDEANSDFDLIVWVRYNNTDAGGDVSNTLCNITWDGNITSSTAPDHTYSWVDGDWLMVNFVWDNSNSGYTIERGETVEAYDMIPKAYT